MDVHESVHCTGCGKQLGAYIGEQYHTVIETPHVPPGYFGRLCDSCHKQKYGKVVTPDGVIDMMVKVIEAALKVISSVTAANK